MSSLGGIFISMGGLSFIFFLIKLRPFKPVDIKLCHDAFCGVTSHATRYPQRGHKANVP